MNGLRDEGKRILVVRSGSLRYLLVVLESLDRRFPNSQITVLTDPDIIDELSRHPKVARIVVYGNLKGFLSRQLWQLRQQEYDIKVSLFTGEDEGRYNKFKVLAFLCRAGRMIVYNENGDSFEWNYHHRRSIWNHIEWRLRQRRFPGFSTQYSLSILERLMGILISPFAFLRLSCSVGWLFAKRWYHRTFGRCDTRQIS